MSNSRESCDLKRVEASSKDSLWDLEQGELFFRTAENGQIWFNCMPPGGALCCIPMRPMVDPKVNGGHSWQWDGNEDKPTLSPSINADPQWHGFVKAGRAVSC